MGIYSGWQIGRYCEQIRIFVFNFVNWNAFIDVNFYCDSSFIDEKDLKCDIT